MNVICGLPYVVGKDIEAHCNIHIKTRGDKVATLENVEV